MNKSLLIRLYNWIDRKDSPDYIWNLREKALKSGILGLYYKFIYNKNIAKCNSSVPLNSFFANKPSFPHGIRGIFISSGATIGENCVIFHQVTIGSNTLQDSKGYGVPVLGNNVYIGCGAKIIGGVKIGNGVRIGANCVVIKDVPDNATVVLNECKIIEKENFRNNQFEHYSIK